jgi:hypothetical protein
MTRRNFITVLAGAAAYPLSAGAQQKVMPVIGLLGNVSPGLNEPALAAFHQGLSETGGVEGQTWRSNTVGRMVAMIGCPLWPPISLLAR